jgi:signal transduction histidine kinase
LLDNTGALVRIDGVVSDITARKQLEEQLLHAQKLEAVGRLAGGIAHDFNNLLTAVFGHCDLLLDSVEATSQVRWRSRRSEMLENGLQGLRGNFWLSVGSRFSTRRFWTSTQWSPIRSVCCGV